MEALSPKPNLSGITLSLVKAGLLTEEVAQSAQEQAAKSQTALLSYLVTQRLVKPLEIAQLASQEFGLPLMDLAAFDPTHFPEDAVRPDLIKKYRIIPLFKRGNRLFIALADPGSHQVLEEIKQQSRLNTEAVIVEVDKLNAAVDKLLSAQDSISFDDIEGVDLASLEISSADDEGNSDTVAAAADDAPIVRFVNKVIIDAITQGASDIHFEPYEKEYRIRFRQDGILTENIKPPANLSARISSRLKVMAHLDISERRVPQDGRFKMRLSATRSIDFRVSTCPTLFGEKVVMRILDPTNAQMGIDALGYEPFQRDAFMRALSRPQGLILVTGPTGSGKTVSLYTALNVLNTPENNISTCEDPVEINLSGVNQVNVNLRAGMTFPVALRSFLRQDPDVIMVGEIRDLETAEIAIKAAQTGHLVLSTLHTNSAAETLNRLANMGVEAYNLATSVALIIAQRLARKLCPHCKTPVNYPEKTLLDLGYKLEELVGASFFTAKGCELCKEGYKGRMGVYEVMTVDESLSYMVLEGANAIDIQKKAESQGMWTLRSSALNKLKLGLTSLEEVNRITSE